MIHGLLCANQLTTMGIEATYRNSAKADLWYLPKICQQCASQRPLNSRFRRWGTRLKADCHWLDILSDAVR